MAAEIRAQLQFVAALSFLMGIHAALPLAKHQQLIRNTTKVVSVDADTLICLVIVRRNKAEIRPL